MFPNEEYYTREKIKHPLPPYSFFNGETFKKINPLYAIIAFLLILVSPYLLRHSRYDSHYPRSFPEYLEQLSTVIIAFVAILFVIYICLFLAERFKKEKDYYFTGKFNVIEKSGSLFGEYLTLSPGQKHKIRVFGESLGWESA